MRSLVPLPPGSPSPLEVDRFRWGLPAAPTSPAGCWTLTLWLPSHPEWSCPLTWRRPSLQRSLPSVPTHHPETRASDGRSHLWISRLTRPRVIYRWGSIWHRYHRIFQGQKQPNITVWWCHNTLVKNTILSKCEEIIRSKHHQDKMLLMLLL